MSEERRRTPDSGAPEDSYRYFENRACRYYPCHDMEHINCLFCYCPLYALEHCPGDHYYKEVNGKQLKVCTNCTFPHKAENYDVIMQFLRKAYQ